MMAVDITAVLGPKRSGLIAPQPLRLGDDGYYWHLYPCFTSLSNTCGELIDLYGNAMFRGDDLEALQLAVEGAIRDLEGRPEAWRVHVGTKAGPSPEELFEDVSKARCRELLERLLAIASAARASKGAVQCLGD